MKRKNKGSLKSKVAEIIMTSGRQDSTVVRRRVALCSQPRSV